MITLYLGKSIVSRKKIDRNKLVNIVFILNFWLMLTIKLLFN